MHKSIKQTAAAAAATTTTTILLYYYYYITTTLSLEKTPTYMFSIITPAFLGRFLYTFYINGNKNAYFIIYIFNG